MIKYVGPRIISGRDIRLGSLQFLQSFGGTENPHYICAAKQKKHHETDTIILQTARRFRQILLDASADGVF